MDVSKEGLTGGMPGGMMDNMMCPRDPCEILKRLIQSEQSEIPVYKQLAQTAPSTCLKMMFAHLAEEDTGKVQRLCDLAKEFGCGSILPGIGTGPGHMVNPPGSLPSFFSEGENNGKE